MRNEGQDCDYGKHLIVVSSFYRSHNLVLRSSFITHPSITFCIVFYLLFAVVTILSFVPHSLLTHLLLSVQCFIFCLPQSQSCPSFLIHYSPIYYFLYSVLSSVYRSHNLVLRSSFITHPSITFCIVFYLLFTVVTILSFVPHSLLTHLLLSVQCFIFCLPQSQSCPSFLIHYSPIYYFLYSVLSSVYRSHNLVLRSSFITHPSITFCIVFYLLFTVVTILSFVPHSLLTHLLLSVQCFIFCLSQSQSCPSFLIHYSPIYYFLYSVLSSVYRSHNLVLRSSFITHPSITFCIVFYLLFTVVTILSFVPHSLLTHLLLSVQCFIFCLPQSQSCPSFLIHYSPIYYFLYSVLSSVYRSHNLVLRSSFITHPSITFCIVFYLLFTVVTILSFVPHSLLTHLLLSVQCFIFCLPQSQSCPSFLIHYSPIYYFLYSVLSSVYRSHNLVLRSSFITHPSITFCIVFYLLFTVVTILSFVPHSLLTHLLLSVQCFIFCLPQSQSCPSFLIHYSPIYYFLYSVLSSVYRSHNLVLRSSFITHPSITFCIVFYLLFTVVTILSFVPHSLLTHLLLSVQCFIFCLPQSQSCPSFLIHYSPIYYFLYSVLSSVYRSHNLVLRSSFITHPSITFCIVFYLLFTVVTILSFVPHSLLTHLLLSVQCFIFCLPQSQSCPSFLIHYSPIYYFLYSVLSSVYRSHNLVLRSSFITHPSITFCIVFYLLRTVVTILSFVPHSLLTHLLLSVQCFIFCLSQSQSCPSFLIHYSPIYYFLYSVLSSVYRSHNLVLRSSFITHPSITFCIVFYLLFTVVTILSFVPHSLLTHLLLSVQCFIFCLPQSQSCPSFLIHYSPIYYFLYSVLSSVYRSHNLVLRSSFITHPSITFCIVFYLLFTVVTILSFVPHSLLTHLLLSVQCFIFCLPQSQSCPSFLIHYSPIYYFLYSVLSSVYRSHNLVLRSSFITHPSITFCIVFYLLFTVVTILSFVPHSLLTHLLLSVQCFIFCLSQSQSCPSFLIHYSPIYYFLYSVLSSVYRSHNLVLRSSFITHPSITFCIVFYLLFVVVTILSFVPHSLLTHLLLSVQCFIFCLPQSQSCPSFLIHYSPIYYFLYSVLSSVYRSHNLVLRSSFITHPSITFCIVFYLLFTVVTILSFVPHSLLTHLLLSVQCFIFCLPQSQSCPSFLIHYSPIYYFLYSVLSSVCRSHNLVLRSSFITHPSITFCIVFYLLFTVVTILSFVPHSLLTHLLLSVQCFIFCLRSHKSQSPILRSSFITHPSITFCIVFYLLFTVVTILSFCIVF